MATAQRSFKDAVYEQLARLGKALSAPKRLELLDLLAQSPRTVEALADEANLSMANASRHLQILRGAQLVRGHKHGLHVEYCLADDDVSRLYVELRGLGEARLAEMQRITRDYFQARGALEPVDEGDLLARVRAGAVTVLDVRPSEEFHAGHLPGALSIPVAELEARLAEIPHDRSIVAYCRGPYCVMALDAVELLRRHGFAAERLEKGVADWRARGWQVETTSPSQTEAGVRAFGGHA